MRARPRALTALFVLAPLLTAAACGDATSPADAVAGTYVLQRVNGLQLPYAPDTTGRYAVFADTLTLARDGRWTEARWTAVEPWDAPARAAAFGTWARDGDTLRLGDPAQASRVGARFAVLDRGRQLASPDGALPGFFRLFGRVR